MSVSQAAEAMRMASEQVNTAKSVLIQHRGRSRDWRSHVAEAHDIHRMTSHAFTLLVNLADVLAAAATSTRRNFLDHPAPGGQEWPQVVVETGRETAQAQNRLRHQLSRLPIREAYDTAAQMHAALQNAARDANRAKDHAS